MADNPELKAFADYHKHTSGLYKAHNAIDEAVAGAQKGMLNDLNTFYQKGTDKKTHFSFKEDKDAKKFADGLYESSAKSLFMKYFATKGTEHAEKLYGENERLRAGIEDLLEMRFDIKRDEFTNEITNRKYFNAENMLEHIGNMFKGVKQYEGNFVVKKATQKFWEDPKTFNKYLRTIVDDNIKSGPAAPLLIQAKDSGKFGHLFDPKRKGEFNAPLDMALWSQIAPYITDKYDFKKKLEELADKK